ncbi:hypothetical protein OH77DRAFT_50688 [Trametes cingulata]|nr:hypothetical protein OH77DRAFT_50688 [Trametes cingulata]
MILPRLAKVKAPQYYSRKTPASTTLSTSREALSCHYAQSGESEAHLVRRPSIAHEDLSVQPSEMNPLRFSLEAIRHDFIVQISSGQSKSEQFSHSTSSLPRPRCSNRTTPAREHSERSDLLGRRAIIPRSRSQLHARSFGGGSQASYRTAQVRDALAGCLRYWQRFSSLSANARDCGTERGRSWAVDAAG